MRGFGGCMCVSVSVFVYMSAPVPVSVSVCVSLCVSVGPDAHTHGIRKRSVPCLTFRFFFFALCAGSLRSDISSSRTS